MYYHIVKQEGLKYKNLDLKEVEEVVKKKNLISITVVFIQVQKL